jgi:hypothetical protein
MDAKHSRPGFSLSKLAKNNYRFFAAYVIQITHARSSSA